MVHFCFLFLFSSEISIMYLSDFCYFPYLLFLLSFFQYLFLLHFNLIIFQPTDVDAYTMMLIVYSAVPSLPFLLLLLCLLFLPCIFKILSSFISFRALPVCHFQCLIVISPLNLCRSQGRLQENQ